MDFLYKNKQDSKIFFCDKNYFILNYRWQFPAKTELAAYESLLKANIDSFYYIAFPWATFIDLLRKGQEDFFEFIYYFNLLSKSILKYKSNKPVVTVCQHIDAHHFFPLFESAGITDLFWSHARTDMEYKSKLNIHSFPLFPAQAPILEKFYDEKKYISNFIGASGKSYLSNVRNIIFEHSALKNNKHKIIRRDFWHFENIVYGQQIQGKKINKQLQQNEINNSFEYIESIKYSKFTLCPTGTGPNSIRIYEAINLGSIPIILTDKLKFIEDYRHVFEQSCIICSDDENGLNDAISIMLSMTEGEFLRRFNKLNELAAFISSENYFNLIKSKI